MEMKMRDCVTRSGMDASKRETLMDIQAAAREQIVDGMNPMWRRAYEDLMQAASVVDAFIARGSVPADQQPPG